MGPGAVTEAAHARLARLDAAERQPERRADEHAVTEHAREDRCEHEVVVLRMRSNDERPDGREGYVGDAVVAAGERRPPVRDAPDDVAERERDEDEVHAARADREAEDGGEQRAGAEPGGRGERRRHAVADLQDRDRIRGHGEERGVAQREQPGVAEQEIGGEREQTEDQHLRGEPHPERAGGVRQRQRRCQRDHDQHRPVHYASLPAIPRGRRSSSSAMGANSTKYENSGNSQRPYASSRPTTSAPIIAPPRLPRPPTITTTSA